MKTYHVIGLMSGTSLDGLDICYASFTYPALEYSILVANTVKYNAVWERKLKNSFEMSAQEIIKLDFDYGVELGRKVNEFIKKHEIKKVDFIASHGHTVFHQPKKKYTLQVGKGSAIQSITGIRTVCDFRSQDVTLGGQGAPLVPIGDELLFGAYDACLNLGGFSNISFKYNNERVAFDVSPMNLPLNYITQKMNLPFDVDGKIAQSGVVNKGLLDELNALEYYQQVFPKSLGIEFCMEYIFPLIEKWHLKNEDLLATMVQHIVQQITKVFKQYSITKVLLTGGGAKNMFMVNELKKNSSIKIHIPNNDLVDFKEALIFGLLGVLRIENQINVLKTVTGAVKNHCSGSVYG